jgi:hypothetical protein
MTRGRPDASTLLQPRLVGQMPSRGLETVTKPSAAGSGVQPAAGSRQGRPTGSGEGLGRCSWLRTAGSRRTVPDPDPVLAVRRLRRAGRDLRDHERNWSQQEMTSQGASATQAALSLTAFWGMVTVGRLLFAQIVRWLPARIVFHQLHPARRRLTADAQRLPPASTGTSGLGRIHPRRVVRRPRAPGYPGSQRKWPGRRGDEIRRGDEMPKG